MRFQATTSILYALSAPAFAAIAENAADGDQTIANNSVSGVLGIVNSLMLVVLLILVLAWAFRRFVQPTRVSGGEFRVLQVSSLGNRQKIVLFRAGDTQLLIGVSPNHMCLLSSGVDGDMDHGLQTPERQADPLPFSGMLKKFKNQGSDEPDR